MEDSNCHMIADEARERQRGSCNDMEEPEVKFKAPDGGWGWVVCFACFVTHVLIDGVTYSFGIIFAELLDYYKGSKAETAWVISLSTGVCYLCCPLVAALNSRFGCRIVAGVGTIVTSVSLIISIYTPNLHFLYFSFGIMFGVGYGMTYLSTIVCVSEYFDKRRAFATGLGVCGSGVGTFIFSPLTAVLIETYAWRGAILIQAGLILNCLACSLVYRPLEELHNDKPLLEKKRENDTNSSANIYTHFNKPGDIAINTTNNAPENVYALKELDAEKAVDVNKRTGDKYVDDLTSICDRKEDKRKRSFISSEYRTAIGTAINRFIESLRLDLLKMKALSLFIVSYFFYSLGYFTPYVYLPVKSRDVGVSEIDAAWLLSTIGITNTLGRVVFGFLSDKPWVNRLYLYSTALVICGIGTSLGPVLSSFPSLLVYAAVFGTFSGVTISLTSVLVTDIVGIRNLSSAFGIVNFVAGIAVLVGPPIGGWLYDITGSYNGSFLAAGIFIVVSGAVLFIIPCVEKDWKKQT